MSLLSALLRTPHSSNFLPALIRLQPLSTGTLSQRWHRDKVENRTLRRYGYEDTVMRSGPLPRLTNDAPRITPMPLYRPEAMYAPSLALQGQNDYIDILGCDDFHVSRAHYHIPKWLRAFQHTTHFQALIKKRPMMGASGAPEAFPKDWDQMIKMMKRYYKNQWKHMDQRRWTNYVGLKFGPTPNPYKTRYPF